MNPAMKDMISMEDLLKDSPVFYTPEPGTIVEGSVITVHKNRVLVDLGGVTTGVIAGREAVDSDDTIKELKEGDEVSALVLEPENDEGLVVLSLRKASQHRTWKQFVEFYESKKTIPVKVTEANKGGLLIEKDSIKGFIPVSQLAPLHYPRVNGADSAKILARLQKLVGETLNVRIINMDPDTRKLVLSEKDAQEDKRKEALKDVSVGEVVQGQISGVVNFGIFVTFKGLEGLVHISEIAWGHVNDPSAFGKLGDDVEVKVIGIEGEKISLSMKQLSENPWHELAEQYKLGQKVTGKVNRITDYGVFISLADDINGLIHVSEVSEDEEAVNMNDHFEIGQEVEAVIINVDVDNHRIGLTLPENKERIDQVVNGSTSSASDSGSGSDLAGLGLSDKIMSALEGAGYKSFADLKDVSEEDLTNLDGVGPATAAKILAAAS